MKTELALPTAMMHRTQTELQWLHASTSSDEEIKAANRTLNVTPGMFSSSINERNRDKSNTTPMLTCARSVESSRHNELSHKSTKHPSYTTTRRVKKSLKMTKSMSTSQGKKGISVGQAI